MAILQIHFPLTSVLSCTAIALHRDSFMCYTAAKNETAVDMGCFYTIKSLLQTSSNHTRDAETKNTGSKHFVVLL